MTEISRHKKTYNPLKTCNTYNRGSIIFLFNMNIIYNRLVQKINRHVYRALFDLYDQVIHRISINNFYTHGSQSENKHLYRVKRWIHNVYNRCVIQVN